MKQSKRLLLVLLGVLAFATAAVLFTRYFNWKTPAFCDLSIRMNEIECSSTRVNPLDVFSHKTVHDKFEALWEGGGGEDKWVHAYPPWHTTYFYFYNLMHRSSTLRLMPFLYGIAFTWVFMFAALVFRQHLPMGNKETAFAVWGVFSSLSISYVALTIDYLNYSVLIAGLTALMMFALEKKHDVLAGVCWALAMIKPQIAICFFWPLLFSKRYVAIFTAGTICFLATLFPAWLYNQSPFELILRIPEIGKPFLSSIVEPHFQLARRIFGFETGTTIATCAAFLACGVLSWVFRNAKEWWLKFAPAAAFVPNVSFCMPRDWICMWPLDIMIVLMALGSMRFAFSHRTRKVLFIATIIYIADLLVLNSWMLANEYGWPVRGAGIFYYISQPFKPFFLAVAAWSILHCQPAAEYECIEET